MDGCVSKAAARRFLVIEPDEERREAVRNLVRGSSEQETELVFASDLLNAENLTQGSDFDLVLAVVDRNRASVEQAPEIEFSSLEQDRSRLYEEASSRAEFERRLLATVGHDLRTPLSAVVSVVQLLELRYPGEALLQRLHRSARRIGELVDDIMVRSEMFLASSDRQEQEIDVASVIEEAIFDLQTEFQKHSIVTVGEGPVMAKLNSTRLTQTITNLVRNAVQHGAQDQPVTVRHSPLSEHVSVTVHNCGKPIPAPLLPKLFDPFHRGEDACGRGAGFGLFIVKELVTDLGGSVSVDSGEHGTTFTLLLPRNRGAK